MQDAIDLWPPPDHRPELPAGVPRCGHGCRSLGGPEIREGGHPHRASTMLAVLRAGVVLAIS
jgi:hypothetical protein